MKISLTSQAYRAALLYFTKDPCKVQQETSYVYYEDGLLIVDQGRIVGIGSSEEYLVEYLLNFQLHITHTRLSFLDLSIHMFIIHK